MRDGIAARTLREERRALVGWTLGTALYTAFIASFYPTMRDNAALQKAIESYPPALKEAFGLGDITQGTSYLYTELFSLVVPVLFLIFAVLYGSDATAGEEDRRTIDLVLAQPVRRRRLVLAKLGALTAGLALMSTVLFLALVALGAALDMGLDLVHLGGAIVAVLLLALDFGALAVLVGAWSGSRGLARGATAALALLAYMVSTLASIVGGLDEVKGFSLFDHAVKPSILESGLGAVDASILVGTLVALVVASLWAFERRDLVA